MRSRHRLADQSGSTLLLIVGVVATLAVLSATLVMVTLNTQGATAANRTQVQAFDVAEAGLDSAVAGVGSSWPGAAGSSFSQTDLRAAFTAAFPTSDYPDANARPVATIIAYDDLTPIDKSIVWDSNGNGRMWLEARGVFSSKAAVVRTQVERKVTTTSAIQPGVAVYSGGNVAMSGTGQIGNVALTQDAAIYAKGNLSRSEESCMRVATAYVGGTEQIPGWMVGRETWLTQPAPAPGYQVIPDLASFIPQTMVDSWVTTARAADPNGTVIATPNAGTSNYTCPYPAAKFVGNLTLGSSSGKTPLYSFGSLYVTGNLTINADARTKIDSLYVGGNLTVTAGPGKTTTPDQDWGVVFVEGDVSINSAHFCEIDLLATNGDVTVGSGARVGGDGVGTNAKPTLFALVGSGKTFTGQGSGGAIFYGVAYTATGTASVTNGNGAAFSVSNNVVSMPGQPFFRGALFAGGDVTVNGGASVAYDANVVANIQIGGTAPVTQTVPGTWQELAPQ